MGTLTLPVDEYSSNIVFYMLDQPCMHPYGSPQVGSHYQGQAGATAARGDD